MREGDIVADRFELLELAGEGGRAPSTEREIDTIAVRPQAVAVLAEALLAQGKVTEAGAAAADAMCGLESVEALDECEAIVRLAHARRRRLALAPWVRESRGHGKG